VLHRSIDRSVNVFGGFPGNVDKRQTTKDESDEEYKKAIVQLKEPLPDIGSTAKTTPDSVLNCLRFYTTEERLSEYVCLECNKGSCFNFR